MNLKHIITLLFLLPAFIYSQQKYYVYKYNNKYGLTDLSGSSIIEGDFVDFEDYKTIDNYVIFKDSEEKYHLINLLSGNQEVFDELKPSQFYSEDEYLAYAKKNKNEFYFGHKTGAKISIPKILIDANTSDIFMVNHNFLYAIGRETIFPEIKKKPIANKSKNKSQSIKKVEPISYPKTVYYLYLFKNNKALQFLHKIKLDDNMFYSSGSGNVNNLFTFYNLKRSPKTTTVDSSQLSKIHTLEVRKWNKDLLPFHFYYEEDFDIATLKVDNTIVICDSNLKVLKTIPYNQENLATDIEKSLGKLYPNDKVSLQYNSNFSPSVSIGPSGNRQAFWKITEKDNKYVLNYLKNGSYVPYIMMPNKPDLSYGNALTIKDNNENSVKIFLNNQTLELAIPQKYLTSFEITKL